jgi:hypothetical protein
LTLAVVFSLVPEMATANARIEDWIGRFRMNHDGWLGHLAIAQSQTNCLQPAWCRLQARYIDDKGAVRAVRIVLLDSANQHMVFDIAFPGNSQRFNGYLFSFDRNRIAGTTVWYGRMFGFLAEREAATTGGTKGRRMLPDGTIEIDLGDGTRRRVSPSGAISFVDAQGRVTQTAAIEVPLLAPPEPPPGSDGEKWLNAHADSLLNLIVALVPSDPTARTVYLQNEPPAAIYERIKRRTKVANQLVENTR